MLSREQKTQGVQPARSRGTPPCRTPGIRREDGFHFEIVDNEFDEPRIRKTFAPYAKHLTIRIGRAYWWATYTIA